MAQLYNTISVVGFALAGLFLLFAILFWFKFQIPKVISDLSGRTARKSIEEIRARNESSGKKTFRPTPVAAAPGAATDAISVRMVPADGSEATERLTPIEEQTALLAGDATEQLQREREETEVLSEKTEVLNGNAALAPDFLLVQNIVLIHTNETI